MRANLYPHLAPIDVIDWLDQRRGTDYADWEAIEEGFPESDIAQLIYDLRTEAGLTQTQLARMIGSHQPTIARLEDADYHGHSLKMLVRIAFALGKRVKLQLADSDLHDRMRKEFARQGVEMPHAELLRQARAKARAKKTSHKRENAG